MGWRDRGYNRGADAAHNFFSNPATILSFALPIGTWFGSRVVLHFWFLLGALFIFMGSMGAPLDAAAAVGLLFCLLMIHEFAHRFAARKVGGQHEEFVLWVLGGMNPVVTPPSARSMFIGNVAGIAANVCTCAVAAAALMALNQQPFESFRHSNPIAWLNFAFSWPQYVAVHISGSGSETGITILRQVFIYSLGLVVVNLLPYAWFDGANIWQAILWPITGFYRAVYTVCIAGMVIAVPMFGVALMGGQGQGLMGMILWVLLFSSSYVRFQQLRAMGQDGLDEAFGYASSYPEMPRRKRRRGWFRMAARKARKDQKEQARIDAILAKVHEKGLHSLTWWEKRALRKATERQRQEDLAERF